MCQFLQSMFVANVRLLSDLRSFSDSLKDWLAARTRSTEYSALVNIDSSDIPIPSGSSSAVALAHSPPTPPTHLRRKRRRSRTHQHGSQNESVVDLPIAARTLSNDTGREVASFHDAYPEAASFDVLPSAPSLAVPPLTLSQPEPSNLSRYIDNLMARDSATHPSLLAFPHASPLLDDLSVDGTNDNDTAAYTSALLSPTIFTVGDEDRHLIRRNVSSVVVDADTTAMVDYSMPAPLQSAFPINNDAFGVVTRTLPDLPPPSQLQAADLHDWTGMRLAGINDAILSHSPGPTESVTSTIPALPAYSPIFAPRRPYLQRNRTAVSPPEQSPLSSPDLQLHAPSEGHAFPFGFTALSSADNLSLGASPYLSDPAQSEDNFEDDDYVDDEEEQEAEEDESEDEDQDEDEEEPSSERDEDRNYAVESEDEWIRDASEEESDDETDDGDEEEEEAPIIGSFGDIDDDSPDSRPRPLLPAYPWTGLHSAAPPVTLPEIGIPTSRLSIDTAFTLADRESTYDEASIPRRTAAAGSTVNHDPRLRLPEMRYGPNPIPVNNTPWMPFNDNHRADDISDLIERRRSIAQEVEGLQARSVSNSNGRDSGPFGAANHRMSSTSRHMSASAQISSDTQYDHESSMRSLAAFRNTVAELSPRDSTTPLWPPSRIDRGSAAITQAITPNEASSTANAFPHLSSSFVPGRPAASRLPLPIFRRPGSLSNGVMRGPTRSRNEAWLRNQGIDFVDSFSPSPGSSQPPIHANNDASRHLENPATRQHDFEASRQVQPTNIAYGRSLLNELDRYPVGTSVSSEMSRQRATSASQQSRRHAGFRPLTTLSSNTDGTAYVDRSRPAVQDATRRHSFRPEAPVRIQGDIQLPQLDILRPVSPLFGRSTSTALHPLAEEPATTIAETPQLPLPSSAARPPASSNVQARPRQQRWLSHDSSQPLSAQLAAARRPSANDAEIWEWFNWRRDTAPVDRLNGLGALADQYEQDRRARPSPERPTTAAYRSIAGLPTSTSAESVHDDTEEVDLNLGAVRRRLASIRHLLDNVSLAGSLCFVCAIS